MLIYFNLIVLLEAVSLNLMLFFPKDGVYGMLHSKKSISEFDYTNFILERRSKRRTGRLVNRLIQTDSQIFQKITSVSQVVEMALNVLNIIFDANNRRFMVKLEQAELKLNNVRKNQFIK